MLLYYSLDLEATGPDPMTDRITQFALVPNEGPSLSSLVNPEREIPAEVVALTGITNWSVKDLPTFTTYAQTIANLIKGVPLVTYNGLRFDVPLLAEEFERAGVAYEFGPIIDCDSLFKQHATRTLSDAVFFYLARQHEGAHSAAADAIATGEIFEAMLVQHPKLSPLTGYKEWSELVTEAASLSCHGRRPADPHAILVWDEQGDMAYTHKRVRGVKVKDDPNYGEWLLRSNFPASTKRVLAAELDRLFPAAECDDGMFDQ